ncbi:MAG: urea ABC transporter permease subunit UrtC, partial [Azoarcus sp.]|nr:urea ABC transporter permease subunit UrtC [Azoarcus sp.]
MNNTLSRRLLTPKGWMALAAFAFATLILIPVLHLAFPEGHALHLPIHWVSLAGKIMCFAIVALAMDLIWGYAGILSLGHGLFFALGGYGMGMYL